MLRITNNTSVTPYHHSTCQLNDCQWCIIAYNNASRMRMRFFNNYASNVQYDAVLERLVLVLLVAIANIFADKKSLNICIVGMLNYSKYIFYIFIGFFYFQIQTTILYILLNKVHQLV